MKRLISLSLALLLVLSACCALAEVEFTTKYFTIPLPDGWKADTDTSDVKQDEDSEFLGIFYEDKVKGLVVEAYLVYYEELKNVSLWNSDFADMPDYFNDVMKAFEDENPENLGIVKAGSIPFVLIKATDKDGEYLYAETVTNGYAIQFAAYVTDEKAQESFPLQDADIAQFKAILEAFKPVTGS